jgi:hypothetical protein
MLTDRRRHVVVVLAAVLFSTTVGVAVFAIMGGFR